MEAGKLTRDEQVRLAARTTVSFLFLFFLRTSLTIVIITDYAWSAWQWTDAPPVDADFQPS
jgi:hypothetical protein